MDEDIKYILFTMSISSKQLTTKVINIVNKIIQYIKENNVSKAKAEWAYEADKIVSVPFVYSAIESVLGCARHNKMFCEAQPCADLKSARYKKLGV